MTDQTKHTPGPWTYSGANTAGAGGLLLGHEGQPIAVVYGERANANSTANGMLAAAAPDLLQAAEIALRFLLNAGHRSGDAPFILRDAIRKATGSAA